MVVSRFFRELDRDIGGSIDAFGKIIADGTRNTLDMPSIYPFNPERHRLKLNGSRVKPSDVAGQFTDSEASFDLSPDAGNTLTFHTAERPRYIVGYDAAASTAGKLNAELGSSDTYEVGLRDFDTAENKAFFEFTGDGGRRAVLVDEGTEVATEPFNLPDGLAPTDPIRYEIVFNAYDVGRWLFTISYTDDSEREGQRQRNETVAELAVDGDYALGEYNHHLYQELDAATSGQTAAVGSFGYQIRGNIQETNRVKAASFRDMSYGGSGDFEALGAIRIKNGRENTYCQLQNVSVFPDSGSGRMIVVVVDGDDTDASGFAEPVEMSSKNNAIEATTSVTEFPDADGNTVTADPNPNGYQIGFSTYESAGVGSTTRTQPSQTVENKRPLYPDDVALFLYEADTANTRTVNMNYFVEQDW